jgi:tetratricopeptide (TPR) repeat protein
MESTMDVGGAAIDSKLMRVAALLDTDPSRAAREAAQILKDHPGHTAATLLLGTALSSCGDSAQATSAFAGLAAAQPDSALIQLELGRALAAQGQDIPALIALTRAADLEPNLAEAWRELASLHAACGDAKNCDVAYANYCRLAPPEHHLGEVALALANRRFGAAEELLRRRLAAEPQDVAALRMLAAIAAEREDYIEAERLYNSCLTLAPGYSRARFELARILLLQQKADPILPLAERLLELEPDNLRYNTLQAAAYTLLGQNQRAIDVLSALIAQSPCNEALWLAIGHSLRTAGRLSEAIAAYRKSTQLRPESGEAWFSLANLKTFRFTDGDLGTMEAQVTRPELDDSERLQFEFALGKALEDVGNFADSFAHYSRGNALRRAQVQYDGEVNAGLAQRTRALYTKEFFAARDGSGCAAPDPIFVVGLPRSGSTLLEQILASHSHVEGTRELPDVPGIAYELGAPEAPGRPSAYPQSVVRLTREDLTTLGERYLAQTRPNRLLGRQRFIDKMPSNFFHVGLIQLILPNARIIDARRSPLGCCFANFKQHFQSGLWFTYNLDELARYYRDYVQLMEHFDTVLPGRVHRVYYENLVADLEGEVRRLLDYCGLPFEEQCLRFHENRRVVQTASSEQVRQPLYADSVEQWRNYEPWLDKLKEALGDIVQQYPAKSAFS